MVLVWNPRGKAQSSLSASSICINYLQIKCSFHWVGWWLKTKCQPKCFFDVSIRKEKWQGCPLLFSIWNDNKNFGWHLVFLFSIWFLVTDLSNEMNKVCIIWYMQIAKIVNLLTKSKVPEFKCRYSDRNSPHCCIFSDGMLLLVNPFFDSALDKRC